MLYTEERDRSIYKTEINMSLSRLFTEWKILKCLSNCITTATTITKNKKTFIFYCIVHFCLVSIRLHTKTSAIKLCLTINFSLTVITIHIHHLQTNKTIYTFCYIFISFSSYLLATVSMRIKFYFIFFFCFLLCEKKTIVAQMSF